MAVACPECGSNELDLIEVLDDGRRQLRCEDCDHEWPHGDPERSATKANRPNRDPAEAKDPIQFVDDDEAYLEWTRTWPGGYVLNCERNPGPNYLMLHRAHCDTITETGGLKTTWTTTYIKVCSTDRQELRRWAEENAGGKPTVCQLCG